MDGNHGSFKLEKIVEFRDLCFLSMLKPDRYSDCFLVTVLQQGSEDVIRLEEKTKSMKLEEQRSSQTRLSESSLDLAMAARLASAEALAAALTEAATSVAAGEVDGSEAGKVGSYLIG